MIKTISNEEELNRRKKKFKKIKQGTLFNFSKLDSNGKTFQAYFIAACKPIQGSCRVIELTPYNMEMIIERLPCQESCISFNQMKCLNICS